MSILRCKVLVNEVGTKQFIPFALEEEKQSWIISDGIVVFNVFPRNDVKIDMRQRAPFHSIIPCPWCGTENDRKHNLDNHIDKRFGIPIGEKFGWEK